jgi:hypothetical protein
MLVKVREQHKTHPVNAEAAFATAERLESWETWHKRFGHVSYSSLQRLLEANLVEGFKVDTLRALKLNMQRNHTKRKLIGIQCLVNLLIQICGESMM